MSKNYTVLGIATLVVVFLGVAIYVGTGIRGVGDSISELAVALKKDLVVGGVTNFDSLELSENLTVTASSTFTGTTTVVRSLDGLVVGGTISTAATGTVRTLFTNTTGPKAC